VKVTDYFVSLEKSLRQNANIVRVNGPQAYLISNDFNGLLKCRVHFWDDSFLDIYEVVSTELGYPIRVHYAYTYLRMGIQVFRYDNAPHHPEIVTFPHHKHTDTSEKPSPTDQPTLSQVLSEIEQELISK
jgi:hypothetical protein